MRTETSKYIILIFTLLMLSYNQQSGFAQNKILSPFLLKPTGNYKIGTAVFFLNDSDRNEIYTHKKNDFRRILVRAWYPSDSCNNNFTDYLSGYSPLTLATHFLWLGATPGDFKKLSSVKTNSCMKIPVSNRKKRFPVIIFSHGYGMSLPQFYSTLTENLASNGYIVLAITHPYESIMINYPDGTDTGRKNVINLLKFMRKLKGFRRINFKTDNTKDKLKLIKKIKKEGTFINRSNHEWVEDSKLVVDNLFGESEFDWGVLKNRFDTTKIGALGHSFGGSSTGEFCFEDNRVKAGINLDGWQYGNVIEKGLTCPFLFIGAPHNDWFDLFYKNSKSDFYKVIIPDLRHFSFSDLSVMPNIPDKIKSKYLGTLKPVPVIKLVNSIIIVFFNRYLQNKPTNLSDKQILGYSNLKKNHIKKSFNP